jgi:four helix bundle protein
MPPPALLSMTRYVTSAQLFNLLLPSILHRKTRMVIYHKNLDVYRLAMEFIELAAEIAKRVPRGQGQLADQLRRASGSVGYNIGEGAGEFASREKARFYRIALRSATESATIIDIIHRFGYIEIAVLQRAEHVLERIIQMLAKLTIRHADDGAPVIGIGRRDRDRARDR